LEETVNSEEQVLHVGVVPERVHVAQLAVTVLHAAHVLSIFL